MPFPFYKTSTETAEDSAAGQEEHETSHNPTPNSLSISTHNSPPFNQAVSDTPSTATSWNSTPLPPAPSTDPEQAAKLLHLYIKSYHSKLVNKTLSLNPSTLRYIAARIRETKRAPPNARFSILDFFRPSTDELSYYDFIQIENSFKELKKIALVGRNEVTELDLRHFQNLLSLRISQCDVVYLTEPDEWFEFQMHRLQDVRIIRGRMTLSAMRSVPHKLKVVESSLAWDAISERWIQLLEEIECIRCKLGQLASLLVPQVAQKICAESDSHENGVSTTAEGPSETSTPSKLRSWQEYLSFGGSSTSLPAPSQLTVPADDESCSSDRSSTANIAPGWQELSRLVVIQNNIRHLDQSLSYCPSLEHLDLRNNQIENLDASMIQPNSLRKLDTVILRNNFLQSLERSKNLLEHVRFLDISHNQLSNLKGVESAVHLKELDISHNSLIDWNDVKRLRKLPLLQTLHLHHNPDLEQHDDYRAYAVGIFDDRSYGFVLDGKAVSRWESKVHVAFSSDSDESNSEQTKNNSLSVSTASKNLEWASAVVTPVLVTPSTPNPNTKKKKKMRKRVRKVTNIPEYSPKVSRGQEAATLPASSSNSIASAEDSPATSNPTEHSEEFFKHMSHFYEDSSHPSDAEEVSDELVNTNDSAVSSEKPSKDVEWTKKHLSSIREDGGDQWLLLLNEYMHPEKKRKRSASSMAANSRRRKSFASEALTDTHSTVNNTVNQQRTASQMISEKNTLSNRNEEDSNLPRYLRDHSSFPSSLSNRIPSFRNPLLQTRINVDFTNSLISDDMMTKHFSGNLGRRRVQRNKNQLYNTNQKRLEKETFNFLKELNLENELGLSVDDQEMNTASDDETEMQRSDRSPRSFSQQPETNDSLADVSSEASDLSETAHSSREVHPVSDQVNGVSDTMISASEGSARESNARMNDAATEDNDSIFQETDSDTSEEGDDAYLAEDPEQAIPTNTPVSEKTTEKEPVEYNRNFASITFSDSTSESSDEEESENGMQSHHDEQEDTRSEDSLPEDESSPIPSTTLDLLIKENTKKNKLIRGGFLFKEGGVWKSWKRRYFKLTEKYWIYGKDVNDTIDIIDTIHILSVSLAVHRKAPRKYQKYGFIVDVGGEINRTYKVCAESEGEQREWVKALKSVLQEGKKAAIREESAKSMLALTNNNCFRLKHAKSNLFMDVSPSGKIVFNDESTGNHIRWRYKSGRIINENLGTVLVSEEDGTCRVMSLEKNPGSGSFWKASEHSIMTYGGEHLTISREWRSKHVNIVAFTQEKESGSENQMFEVIQ